MGTVNFSVPDDVKRAFDRAFAGQNKSGILTRLMREAIEDQERRKRRAAAIDALLELRQRLPAVSTRQVLKARRTGRP